jgi:hypothetical protein
VPVSEPKLEMKIDLNIIEHLGLKMYTSLPAVIAEYVANARDAGATEVDINIPTDGCMEGRLCDLDKRQRLRNER